MEALLRLFSADKGSFPAWHPNFQGLTHITGTSSHGQQFLKTLLMFVLMGCVSTAAYVEWELQGAFASIRNLKQTSVSMSVANAQYVQASDRFLDISHETQMIADFCGPTRDWLQMVLTLFELRPAPAVFKSVGLKVVPLPKTAKNQPLVQALQIRLTGSIRGETDVALQVLETYKETMQSNPLLKDRMLSIEVSNLTRQNKVNLIDFELTATLSLLSP